jgi:hypothetical protein
LTREIFTLITQSPPSRIENYIKFHKKKEREKVYVDGELDPVLIKATIFIFMRRRLRRQLVHLKVVEWITHDLTIKGCSSAAPYIHPFLLPLSYYFLFPVRYLVDPAIDWAPKFNLKDSLPRLIFSIHMYYSLAEKKEKKNKEM